MSIFQGVWIFLLGLSWLIPPILPPWSTFLSDAWIATVAILGWFVFLFKFKAPDSWFIFSCVVGVSVLLPWFQFYFDLIPYFGQAWMASAYILAFLLAIKIGSRWELLIPDQLPYSMFFAIIFASVISVGLQMHSWLNLATNEWLGLLAADQSGNRPAANFGQPNQLATFLTWGLLGCLYCFVNKSIGGVVAFVLAAFLLIGITLTQSRSGFLIISFMLAAIWIWRDLWPNRRLPIISTLLYVLYFLYIPIFNLIKYHLGVDGAVVELRGIGSTELRVAAWKMFFSAILDKPFLGYGLVNVGMVQLEMASKGYEIGALFDKSHNFLLDLMLWSGVVFAAPFVLFLMGWMYYVLQSVNTSKDVVFVLFFAAVGIHSMVEFPLHYLYFLIPTGFIIGIIDAGLSRSIFVVPTKFVLHALVICGFVILCITVSDYMKVDESYRDFRLESSLLGQGRKREAAVPDVIVLTHMREWLKYDNYKPISLMSKKDIDGMHISASYFPAPFFGYRVSKAYKINGYPEEAEIWLLKACSIASAVECGQMRDAWAHIQTSQE